MAGNKIGATIRAAQYYNLSVEEYVCRIKTHKSCKVCKTWKLREEFCKDSSSGDGLSKTCFDCRCVKVKKITKGRPSYFKGKTHTEEAKRKMSEVRKGKCYRQKGWHHSEETKRKISENSLKTAKRGPDSPHWKGGVTPEHKRLRKCPEYVEWRKKVYERDHYTCRECGDDKGGNLNAHHIKNFADYPELRFDVDNGITYCRRCHRRIHHKPDSTRNKLKERKRKVGIVGYRDFISGHNPQPAPTKDAIILALSNKPARIAEIVEITGKTKTAITVALCKMRKQGFVRYVKSKQ